MLPPYMPPSHLEFRHVKGGRTWLAWWVPISNAEGVWSSKAAARVSKNNSAMITVYFPTALKLHGIWPCRKAKPNNRGLISALPIGIFSGARRAVQVCRWSIKFQSLVGLLQPLNGSRRIIIIFFFFFQIMTVRDGDFCQACGTAISFSRPHITADIVGERPTMTGYSHNVRSIIRGYTLYCNNNISFQLFFFFMKQPIQLCSYGKLFFNISSALFISNTLFYL